MEDLLMENDVRQQQLLKDFDDSRLPSQNSQLSDSNSAFYKKIKRSTPKKSPEIKRRRSRSRSRRKTKRKQPSRRKSSSKTRRRKRTKRKSSSKSKSTQKPNIIPKNLNNNDNIQQENQREKEVEKETNNNQNVLKINRFLDKDENINNRMLDKNIRSQIEKIQKEKEEKIKNFNKNFNYNKQNKFKKQKNKQNTVGGNRNTNNYVLDKFLYFVEKNLKLKKLNPEMFSIINKSFRNYSRERFKAICFNAKSNKDIVINVNEAIASNYLKSYDDFKSYYLKESTILLQILEKNLLELETNSKNNQEVFKLKSLNQQQLNQIATIVRKQISNIFYNCQIKYIQSIQSLDEYFIKKSLKDFAIYKKYLKT